MKAQIILSLLEYEHFKVKEGFNIPIELATTDNECVLLFVDFENLRDIYVDIENHEYTFFLKKEHYAFLNRVIGITDMNISCHIQQDVVKLVFPDSDTLMNVYHALESRLLSNGFDKNDNVTSEGEIIEYLMDTFTF